MRPGSTKSKNSADKSFRTRLKKVDRATMVILQKLHLERLRPLVSIALGLILLVALAFLLFAGANDQNKNTTALVEAKQVMNKMGVAVQTVRQVLEDEQMQGLAALAALDVSKAPGFEQYVKNRLQGVKKVQLFSPDISALRGPDLGPYGYAVLDMLLSAAEGGLIPAQIHGKGTQASVVIVERVVKDDRPVAYMLVSLSPDFIRKVFNSALPRHEEFSLAQYNGRFSATPIIDMAIKPASDQRVTWIMIPGTLFQVGVVQSIGIFEPPGFLFPFLLVSGLTFLILGIFLMLFPYQPPQPMEDGVMPNRPVEDDPEKTSDTHDDELDTALKEPESSAIGLPDIGFSLEKVSPRRHKAQPPVELVRSIFRAYDIRGVVGETLDAEVCYQVGQVIGTLALEQDTGPVVVARDGRNSGPELMKGMIDGIASAGCNVINVGAVPTGVLYFAAYELGGGTGVMVTGSHNPSNYNGIKMLIGGVTWAGEKITNIYDRIVSGDVRAGSGTVTEEKIIGQYREKIASDIHLQRPLKVVADCGNGIGGVCAADVLRDIGAEVIPLFDEVNGDFPNHHPDPSDPVNLSDLIGAVNLVDADLGVAFDGDADRLGVVTSSGEIIYSDRLMMLFAKDVLERVPGSTVIYDVKCTGHLHDVIEAAGGKPMMYKTGHSLIKNKMKEVGAPFAGEMSGHFFFKERWYGFDCGIYAAARLLEILAADERRPQDVLCGLPDSISTPELKVHMPEGENHAFITKLQENATFADARINTIDGLRADFPDGWGLVRASNTTPILVVRFEGDSEASLQRIKEVFRQQLTAIDSKLELPF